MPKFKPVPLDSTVNAARSDSRHWGPKTAGAIAKLPTGAQKFWGIPFEFVVDADGNDLVVLADDSSVE
ncbi:MAG: hypothetical protein IH960_11640, partial [Chloroflexi bacterium]|nr:hypothetical protein [Chloroflexota bacterium]